MGKLDENSFLSSLLSPPPLFSPLRIERKNIIYTWYFQSSHAKLLQTRSYKLLFWIFSSDYQNYTWVFFMIYAFKKFGDFEQYIISAQIRWENEKSSVGNTSFNFGTNLIKQCRRRGTQLKNNLTRLRQFLGCNSRFILYFLQ